MRVGNEKYIYLSGEGDVLRGKKGSAGVHVSKSNTAIIIGYYEQPTQHPQCAKEVDNITEYLKSNNYWVLSSMKGSLLHPSINNYSFLQKLLESMLKIPTWCDEQILSCNLPILNK